MAAVKYRLLTRYRLIEQQRREEQLREAIRTADAKMYESKQMNKVRICLLGLASDTTQIVENSKHPPSWKIVQFHTTSADENAIDDEMKNGGDEYQTHNKYSRLLKNFPSTDETAV